MILDFFLEYGGTILWLALGIVSVLSIIIAIMSFALVVSGVRDAYLPGLKHNEWSSDIKLGLAGLLLGSALFISLDSFNFFPNEPRSPHPVQIWAFGFFLFCCFFPFLFVLISVIEKMIISTISLILKKETVPETTIASYIVKPTKMGCRFPGDYHSGDEG